jgi:hypothetical protein
MKHFNPIIDKEGEKTELSVPKPIEKQEKYHGSMVLKPGMKCFEYNFITKQIHEATYEQVNAEYGAEGKVGRKLVMNVNCGYAVGINKKNALKKIGKLHGVKLKATNL